jgi:hypothetical protein
MSVRVRATASFDVEGVATDPTTVVFTTVVPGGERTTYTFGVDSEVSHLGVGSFRLTLVLHEAGMWGFHCQGTGAAEAEAEGWARVERSRVLA